MAPPSFPQGMTLRTIGYAALKYPDLAAELPVPLVNQIGALQRVGGEHQDHMIAQLGSQYLTALLEFQVSENALLHDPSSSQYYFSTALSLLNFLTTSPDVCIRIAKHPAVVHDVVEKLLDPNVEATMRACDRSSGPQFPPATFEDDFGSLLQFVSTILLYVDQPETLHPRISELIPKCQTWAKTYKNSRVRTIANAASRLVMQIQGMDPAMKAQLKTVQAASLLCGATGCGKRSDLTACAGCKIQRYCGREHQKKDWKFHKHICNKGLEEVGGEDNDVE
ncbi:hypothetical protein BP6252_06095 [Coleophoma cylindrospora]|uniref:MYND-type domain-containing protein n=1 Tax=Coleophoma cylindrospora TaxID=1849047 RepID=A0A3D8RLN9_9HELO|nr:hypothetical protein BP6252_06095 [Coleophoma cylindrospora]